MVQGSQGSLGSRGPGVQGSQEIQGCQRSHGSHGQGGVLEVLRVPGDLEKQFALNVLSPPHTQLFPRAIFFKADVLNRGGRAHQS